MTKEEFDLSKQAFCLWNSHIAEREYSYETTKQLLDQLPDNCPNNDDYLNYVIRLEIPDELKKQLKKFFTAKDNPKSIAYHYSNLNEYFLNQILIITNELKITQKHSGVCKTCRIALFYFTWLQNNNITNCSQINHENTRTFLKFSSETMNKTNGFMNNLIRHMRKIFRILSDNGFHNVPDTLLGYKAAKKRNIILPAFTNDEIVAILKVPDTTTFTGLRDFTILSFISMTGIRPKDLREMTYKNIDFIKNEVTFKQQKTSMLLTLPIDNMLAIILSVYVKKARHLITSINDNSFLFPSARDWKTKMTSNELQSMFYSCMKKAGIEKNKDDRKGLYTFRRTIGKWLLESGAYPEMIASILGQRNLNSFKHYIQISPKTLNAVTLDFRWIKKEE